jgi:quercetin dioxygenase-like cupin family protein
MIIKNFNDVPSKNIPGLDGVSKRIIIGKDDGSNEIVLRHFSLDVGKSTPHHTHGFPHLVKIESGQGSVTDMSGTECLLKVGDYVYVTDFEIHHFSNTGTVPFEFICIVPERGES